MRKLLRPKSRYLSPCYLLKKPLATYEKKQFLYYCKLCDLDACYMLIKLLKKYDRKPRGIETLSAIKQHVGRYVPNAVKQVRLFLNPLPLGQLFVHGVLQIDESLFWERYRSGDMQFCYDVLSVSSLSAAGIEFLLLLEECCG